MAGRHGCVTAIAPGQPNGQPTGNPSGSCPGGGRLLGAAVLLLRSVNLEDLRSRSAARHSPCRLRDNRSAHFRLERGVVLRAYACGTGIHQGGAAVGLIFHLSPALDYLRSAHGCVFLKSLKLRLSPGESPGT